MDNPPFIRIPVAVLALALTSSLGVLGGCASTPAARPSKDYVLAKPLAEPAPVDAQLAELRAQLARSLKAAQESQAAAERDERRLALRAQEADQARQQLALAQKSTDQARQDRSDARIGNLEMELKDLNAKKTDRGVVVTLGDALFYSGQSRMLPGSAGNMAKLADFFKRNPHRHASIEGYTDSTGSTDANYSLAEERSYAVKVALVNMGVQADRLSAQAYGAERPVASNGTAAGRQMNRRVEIVFAQQKSE